MISRAEAVSREEVFLPLSRRKDRGVFFLRLSEYSPSLEAFLWEYHEAARQRGVIIEQQISNPDDRQLSYYTDVLGASFQTDAAFLSAALQKWMPRMSLQTRKELTEAFREQFAEMRQAGKNENIQKNVYIKMMCWLYYRFERLMPFLGEDHPPKVLYEGSRITSHELAFLRMLNALGADILLLETQSDDAYLRLDPESRWSQKLHEPGAGPFPPDYSLKNLRKEKAKQQAQAAAAVRQTAGTVTAPGARTAVPAVQTPRPNVPAGHPAQAGVRPVVPGQGPIVSGQRTVSGQTTMPGQRTTPGTGAAVSGQRTIPGQPTVSGQRPTTPPARNPDPLSRFPAPALEACTNAWMKEADVRQITVPPIVRGDDPKRFYNALIRLTGVRDKLTWENELYQLYLQLTSGGRRVLVIDGALSTPTPEELGQIRRRNYHSPEELIIDLAGNLPASAQVELQRLMQRAFVLAMQEAARTETNLNRLTVTAVYVLCWIRRYQTQLFRGWKETDVPVLVKMGGCESAAEAIYLLYLSRLPVDVLILAPNLNQPCELKTDRLLEITGTESLPVTKFPKQSGNLQMGTVAAHAEQDLTSILYDDTGLYRNRQFDRAEAITLRTTYDELFLLWNQELKYRPNFSTGNGMANLPVIYAKISGVEDGKTLPYWQKIRALKDEGETLLVKQLPFIQPGESNRFQALALKGIRNEKILVSEIRNSRQYPFGLLREEMQAHVFDRLQQMLDERLIRGTFENGTEYTVLATVLNLKKELIRLIQGFDFTKKNPKMVIIHTRDQSPSLEDAILLTFLNRIGFDIVLFVPTGYQTVERFLNDNLPIEHQIGEYLYDLTVPDLDALPVVKGPSWLNNLLRRGN